MNTTFELENALIVLLLLCNITDWCETSPVPLYKKYPEKFHGASLYRVNKY